MDFQRVGPGRQTSHDVELAKQPGENEIGVSLLGQVLDVGQHALQRPLDAADRLFREVLALRVQALLMLQELFAVEVGERGNRYRFLPVGEENRETISYPLHIRHNSV